MFVYDYYTIEVPGDIYPTLKWLGEVAIDEAKERARLYCIPCEWTATHVRGKPGDAYVVFQVRRKRNKT